MSQEVYIEQKRAVSIFDPGTQSATIVDNAAFADIFRFNARTGWDAKIAIGFDVASGAENFASFRVLVNGNPWSDDLYNAVPSRPAATTDPNALTVNLRDVPEGALVQIQGKLVSAGANYTLYCRPRVEYREK